MSEKEQDAALYRHVKGKEPSGGYRSLFQLLKQGYFDVVLTFNFDDLVEKTFAQEGFKDFDLIVPPVDPSTEAEARRRLHSLEPRVKIVKLHGDINKSYYRYSLDQLLEFHQEVKPLFNYLSSLDIIVCGYSFNDLDVLRAVALEGGSMYYVNSEQPTKLVTEILRKRGSAENCIIGAAGVFDRFFTNLAEYLNSAAL